MRRAAVFTVLLALLAVLVAAPASRSAQDGTPAATPAGTPGVGVTTVRLGEGLPQGVGFPFTLWLSRTTFEAGAGAELQDIEAEQLGYTGAIVSFVESGSLTVRVESGTVLAPATIGDDAEATPMAESGAPVAPGTEIVLETGDSIYFESARVSISNASDTDEAVLLNSVLAEETRRCPPCPTYP